MIRPALRHVHTKVGPALSSAQIGTLLKNPTWSVKQLFETPQSEVEIPPESIRKILRMSGLKADINASEEKRVADALRNQMTFIKHLYEDTEGVERESSNDSIFRLLPSDHGHGEKITLKSLLGDIEKLRADPEKGEEGFDISKLSARNPKYFTIKTDK